MTTSVVKNWERAAQEFGCKFEHPFIVDSECQLVEFFGRVISAGGERSVTLHLIDSANHHIPEQQKKAAAQAGLFVSFIVEQRYEIYDRTFFGDTLIDWGVIPKVE